MVACTAATGPNVPPVAKRYKVPVASPAQAAAAICFCFAGFSSSSYILFIMVSSFLFTGKATGSTSSGGLPGSLFLKS